MLLCYGNSIRAQVNYGNDSLKIRIDNKNRIVVNQFSDLDIKVNYRSKLKKRINCYDYLICERKSSFGNCYFELMKLDSNNTYQSITKSVFDFGHPPENIENKEEILKCDVLHSLLKGNQKRVLTVNVFGFSTRLLKGKYVMIFYLRVANNYGYNDNREMVTNSISYLESTPIVFELMEDMLKINRTKQ